LIYCKEGGIADFEVEDFAFTAGGGGQVVQVVEFRFPGRRFRRFCRGLWLGGREWGGAWGRWFGFR